ncbi:unnamed protein product [Bursaphelenchus xylophilus]|nr:unnamed protein product [Bursaphelenchus xylophilus]CAG9125316.1 unnamed protein product [Bursaphelenchus xylophilus]
MTPPDSPSTPCSSTVKRKKIVNAPKIDGKDRTPCSKNKTSVESEDEATPRPKRKAAVDAVGLLASERLTYIHYFGRHPGYIRVEDPYCCTNLYELLPKAGGVTAHSTGLVFASRNDVKNLNPINMRLNCVTGLCVFRNSSGIEEARKYFNAVKEILRKPLVYPREEEAKYYIPYNTIPPFQYSKSPCHICGYGRSELQKKWKEPQVAETMDTTEAGNPEGNPSPPTFIEDDDIEGSFEDEYENVDRDENVEVNVGEKENHEPGDLGCLQRPEEDVDVETVEAEDNNEPDVSLPANAELPAIPGQNMRKSRTDVINELRKQLEQVEGMDREVFQDEQNRNGLDEGIAQLINSLKQKKRILMTDIFLLFVIKCFMNF